jgi:glycosyltransferase involved in cell wall biosynthesis
VKISVIVPAYNEEKLIARCIRSIHSALAANVRPGLETEVIIANNNSTDSTPDIAKNEGARVVFEPINQISRARNAGAAAATGDWFLFIDADSELNADSFRDLLAKIDSGTCAGGGSIIKLDSAPWPGHFVAVLLNPIVVAFKLIAGCFVFCRADAFREIGGFSLELFAAEEIKFTADLKRWARARNLRVVILRAASHITSGRKFTIYTKRQWASFLWKYASAPRKSPRERQFFYYDGTR